MGCALLRRTLKEQRGKRRGREKMRERGRERREREREKGSERDRGGKEWRKKEKGVGEGTEKKGENPLADTGHNLIFTVLGQLYRVICHGMPLKLQ